MLVFHELTALIDVASNKLMYLGLDPEVASPYFS
ncbi:MAG: hypothetical protein ACI9Y1_002739, partial [Lentisphaeria bacterium]